MYHNQWQPNPSECTAETLVRECRLLPADEDVMGVRGLFHEGRTLELAKKFKTWRGERLPGVRAFQSTYDRSACVRSYQADGSSSVRTESAFSFAGGYSRAFMIPSLYPHLITSYPLWCVLLHMGFLISVLTSLFDSLNYSVSPRVCSYRHFDNDRDTDNELIVNDNDDLAHRAKVLLNRMCGIIPPRPLINPVLDAMFNAIQASPVGVISLARIILSDLSSS